jgi:tetratricopeptide (TPR) repeat protein
MDCRRPVALTLSLLAGMAGCSQHAANVPSASTPVAVKNGPKTDTFDPEALKRQPKPETFVAFGDFSAHEAEASTVPVEKEQLQDRARRAYQDALKADPNCIAAQKALARLYVMSNDYSQAKETYDAALKQAPGDASLWFAAGMTYARTKEWGLAVEHLAKASELDPENRSYHRYLGFMLARAGRIDESLAAFGRYEGEAKAHYYLAEMLEHLGQVDPCKTQLQLALAKDPQLSEATQMLVRLSGGPAAPAPAGLQTVDYKEEVSQIDASPASRIPPPPPPLRSTGQWSDATTGSNK